MLGFGFGTGLAAFVTRDGAVACVDRDGLDVCRVGATADGTALRLVDRAGTILWETTAAEGTFTPVEPAHCQEAHSYLVYPGAPERDVAELAGDLLAAGPRPFEPCSLIFDDREDPYEPADPEDAPDADGTSFGAMSVVAQTFLYAEHQHDFSFLQDWANERFGEIEAAPCSALVVPLFAVTAGCRTGRSAALWTYGGPDGDRDPPRVAAGRAQGHCARARRGRGPRPGVHARGRVGVPAAGRAGGCGSVRGRADPVGGGGPEVWTSDI